MLRFCNQQPCPAPTTDSGFCAPSADPGTSRTQTPQITPPSLSPPSSDPLASAARPPSFPATTTKAMVAATPVKKKGRRPRGSSSLEATGHTAQSAGSPHTHTHLNCPQDAHLNSGDLPGEPQPRKKKPDAKTRRCNPHSSEPTPRCKLHVQGGLDRGHAHCV